MASPQRRGFYSSFQYVTLIAGQLLALLVQIVLQQMFNEQQLYAFGWRIPFVIGAIGALVVLWLRLTMEESDQFKPETNLNRHWVDPWGNNFFVLIHNLSSTIYD